MIISGLLPRCMNHHLYDSLNLHVHTVHYVYNVLRLVIPSSSESSISI
jgi:hypothetical protein